MTASTPFAQALLNVEQTLAGRFAALFLSIGSVFSVESLICALGIAGWIVVAARCRRRRTPKARALLRMLFPRRLFAASGKADLGFTLLNLFLTGGLIGGAILSGDVVARWLSSALTGVWGPAPFRALPPWGSGALTTIALFLAYELCYYVDHWLSHRIPALWELHKPHHTAETLTPLTNFRIHPLESLKFLNILGLGVGGVTGLCSALFGLGHEAAFDGRNIIFLGLWLAIGHLQHSNIWVTIPGPLGRCLISPAHHQLHHSADPEHFGKNLGSFLSVFDRLFGTLRDPTPSRERLTFGVGGEGERAHSVTGALIDPVTNAWVVLKRSMRNSSERSPPAALDGG